MNGHFNRRLRALECSVTTEPVVLHMADGTIREISGSAQHWDLLREFAGMTLRSPVPVLNTGPAHELQWLRDCVLVVEPSGQLFALLKTMLAGPMLRRTVNP